MSSISKPMIFGFRPKIVTDFSKDFYKNISLVGMDKFRSVIVDKQIRTLDSDDFTKPQVNKKENRVRNSLDIRWKLLANDRDKVDRISRVSQYEIYALLNVTGRHS